MAGGHGRQHHSHHRLPGSRDRATGRPCELVGINDTEHNARLPDGIEGKSIAVLGKSEMLAALARAFPMTHWGRLLFSAKKSLYKAWYPLTGVGIHEEEVGRMGDGGKFAAK